MSRTLFQTASVQLSDIDVAFLWQNFGESRPAAARSEATFRVRSAS